MPTIVDTPPYDPGFFSCLATVLGALDAFERGAIGDGLRVTLGAGRYFDRARGPNWWEYHFEPLRLGRADGPEVALRGHAALAFGAIVYPRRKAHGLLRRHVRVRADVRAAVAAFWRQRIAGRPAAGVHFRGTDKVGELVSAVSYEQVIQRVRAELSRLGAAARLFVASDEQDFVVACTRAFGERCVFTGAERSRRGGPAVHVVARDPFRAGREALVDCLLLARCNVLVRTSSNLGQFAGYFSPAMPVIKLNRSTFEEA
jgi:hypothetical protein